MNRFIPEQYWEIMQNYFQSQWCVAQTARLLKESFGRNQAETAAVVRGDAIWRRQTFSCGVL